MGEHQEDIDGGRGAVERTGYLLSLVRLRGALMTLITWVTDSRPGAGLSLLDDWIANVRGWSIPHDRAEQRGELLALLVLLRKGWSDHGAYHRHCDVAAALGVVHRWLDGVGGSRP